MNKIKLIFVAAFLSSGLTQASTPCDGFEVKINNKLSENLLLTSVHLQNAEFQPGGIQKLDAGQSEVFTVNKSADNESIEGEFVFHTISLPTKSINIKFNLKNAGKACSKQDSSPQNEIYSIEAKSLSNSLEYTLNHK